MSEEDVRGGLREAVADEPPLDFDPDALVVAARHQIKRRRALVAVGIATAAVAVAAVALPGLLGREQTTRAADQPQSPAASTTTTTTPLKWPPTGVSLVHYTPDELRSRSDQLADRVKSIVTSTLPMASDFTFGEFGGEAAGQFYEGQTGVNAPVSFTIDGARYSLMVTVWVPGVDDPSPTTLCDRSGTDCQRLGDRDGGELLATTDNLGDRDITVVSHFRPTGAVVQFAAYNYDVASTGATVYMPTIPLTIDQLMRLASDPELAL